MWGGGGPGQLIGVTSIDVWNIMTKHPAILDLFKNTMPGLTKADRLTQELGLDRIIIGKARKDTANPGQTASYSRIWGKDFSIVRVSTVASLLNATFGYTMRRTGDPITNQWFDPTKGVDGAYFAQVGPVRAAQGHRWRRGVLHQGGRGLIHVPPQPPPATAAQGSEPEGGGSPAR